MQTNRLFIIAITCLLAAGCAKSTKPDEGAADAVGTDGEISRQAGIDTGGVAGGTEYLEPGMLPGDSTLIQETVIYFDFDTARIRPDYSEALSAHARRLVGNQGLNVRLEGHADERGSREYNIALGDRRAQSVRRVLLFQGASTDQLETVSYGEEQPAMSGHTEEAWAKNRRVELIYTVN